MIRRLLDWLDGKPREHRSPQWPAVERRAFARDGHKCRACGARLFLVGHHVKPFHESPELELVLDNVLTLCQPLGGGDHLAKGHTDKQGRRGWKYINPDAVKDAAETLAKVK